MIFGEGMGNRYMIYIFKFMKQNLGLPLWLLATFLLQPISVSAYSLNMTVDKPGGGKIVLADLSECETKCAHNIPDSDLVSLFATPEPGYRFQTWGGACVNTLGPLCTLTSSKDMEVSVKFVPSSFSENVIKALLLVPEPGVQTSIWNEFVSEYFDNQCPVIYGGVVLEEDAVNPNNQVYCYRLTLGYYSLFATNDTEQALTELPDVSMLKQINWEIRAAILGILNKHTQLSLTIVGQGLSGLAAEPLLADNSEAGATIVGILSLASQAKLMQQQQYNKTRFAHSLTVNVRPDQDGKISAALTALTHAWWLP
ncbi:MAG: hypothetical protein Q7U57_11370 [Methylovulum sp.]|nr:hypothetical protein [Methylovulum sp.]